MPSTLAPNPQRIQAIDAIRGFALLGIFIANMQLFAAPFGEFLHATPGAGMPLADVIAFYFVKIFVDGKFYPTFSLLFGIGLALQWERALAMGRTLLGAGLRRLLVLAVLGAVHIVLLWYGDILLVYSTTGLLLLLLIKARPRTLATIGAIFLGVSVLFSTGFAAISPPPDPSLGAEIVLTPEQAAKPPMQRLLAAADKHPIIWKNIAHPIWTEAETEAMRDGPFVEALKFRLMSYGFFIIFGVVGFWWHVAAMFLFGAALLKAGLFAPDNRSWFDRFLAAGLIIGLPLNIFAVMAPHLMSEHAAAIVAMPVFFLGGPLLALAYVAMIVKAVDRADRGASPLLAKLTAALAAAGRMALTNYLLQTLIAVFVFHHWGLRYFGEAARSERIIFAAAVFSGQVVFSTLWLRQFRFGPMEWLWRSLTYLQVQPLLRRGPRA
jgi:uncharacterized protein